MEVIIRLGTVYLLHFNRAYHHARHYVGFTRDLGHRITQHRAGHRSPLLLAVKNAGIEFTVARTWHNVTIRFERRLHRMHHPLLCPVCAGGRQKMRPGWPRISDYQEYTEDEYPENLEYDGHWEYQPLLVPIPEIQLPPELTLLGAHARDLLTEEPGRE